MKKKIIFLIVILAVAAGGFYWLWTWQPKIEPDFSIGEPSEAPTLFSKEDYKIEERLEGKFIVVEKVGLTCKAPDEWKIEFEGSDVPEPEYWIVLSSPEAEIEGSAITRGCNMEVMAIKAGETVQEMKKNINLLESEPEKAKGELKKDYFFGEKFEVINVDGHKSLKVTSQTSEIGQGVNIDIPIENNFWINFNIVFPSEYKKDCLSVLEEFLNNVEIK